MEIDSNKVITFLFSLLAIVISIVTIIITRRNLKKQLRLGKLEEILEILHFLNGYYNSLFRLFTDTDDRITILISGETLPEYLQELPKYRQGFIETIDKESTTTKISRLKILSNAYLSNSKNLKNKIHTISDIYYAMYMFIYTNGEMPRKEKDAIIPRRGQMEKFIQTLENDIIAEMNLGYKNIDQKSKSEYYKNQFQKDLETK